MPMTAPLQRLGLAEADDLGLGGRLGESTCAAKSAILLLEDIAQFCDGRRNLLIDKALGGDQLQL